MGSEQTNALIRKSWNKLREDEDRLSANSRNSSLSPSSDFPAAKDERKKINTLTAEIRWALSLAIRNKKD
ncbi:hypothetical protein BTN49_1672 [Candidatus Enterovibrio escicola]|uniref:DUF6444 domain-containing protein n=1 Tax=Candidatus Enterovibrio escicola TaxID=1927127 RepID=A0A2A5T3I4_9GAMM|nr:hypothetical protein BTN49_1672 [Candidatus Enterovibrio escacola]